MFGGLQGLVSRSLPALRGMSKEESCRWSPVSKSVASEVLSVAARCRCLALTPLVLPLFADCLEKGHTSHKLRACDSGSSSLQACLQLQERTVRPSQGGGQGKGCTLNAHEHVEKRLQHLCKMRRRTHYLLLHRAAA